MQATTPLEPDRYYHIYNRGNNGENIFSEERNYKPRGGKRSMTKKKAK